MIIKGKPVLFELANRNKKGMAIDLKKKEGRKILYQLVEKSDVFITNFHPVVLERLGATYEILRERNPRIIYAICSTYGLRGPKKDIRRGYDTIGLAYSGAMWAAGDRDSGEPEWIVGAIVDQITSIYTAYGIASALFHRERTGKGQKVETSLIGSAINAQALAINAIGLGATGYKRQARKRAINPLANHYRCADDNWILLCEVQSDRFWHEFCTVTGLQEIENDSRFVNHQARNKNRTELIDILDRIFIRRTRQEWLDLFEKEKVKFAYSPVNTWNDLLTDTQVLENEYIVRFNHPVLGSVFQPGFPVRFSESQSEIQRQAPEHGEHTEEILMDILGYSWEQIAQLKDRSIII
jgi:crotonobetainyl-CoA:carnitine CoA-transferase CaiB-like acyl-CoA transferase